MSNSTGTFIYDIFRKWLFLTNIAVFPTCFVINAPFGRFTPSKDSWFLVDGIKSWILMELVSPAMFIYAYTTSPLSYYDPPLPSWTSPQSILASLFLIHYTNRAILSPLRTPSRSKSHLIVPLSGVLFNTMNGFLMGSYLSSPYARMFLNPTYTFQRPSFYIGLGLWFVGFVGNIVHDEILLDIRRNAKSKGKGKAGQDDKDDKNKKADVNANDKEHYAIPYGLLYKYVSYPNYFCEWTEWFGFALAAAPFPIELSLSAVVKLVLSLLSVNGLKSIAFGSPKGFAPSLTPPWVFFFAEVLAMLPRAYNGHIWYKRRFGDRYPKERKAVVPFLL